MCKKVAFTKYTSLVLLFLSLFSSCIEEYTPVNLYDHQGDLSFSGWLTDLPGKQEMYIRISTPLNINIPDPLPGCHVEVQDDLGNSFVYAEVRDGKYVHEFEEGDVEAGRLYKVLFITPEGKSYESDWEKMCPSAEPGEFQYDYAQKDTREIGVQLPGLQFSVDFEADGARDTVYYKLEVWETWKFRTAYTHAVWFNNGFLGDMPDDSIRPLCYVTDKVPDIFLISTDKLLDNTLEDYPLHFVGNNSQRLLGGYSPELRVYGLSEGAYRYWKNLREIMEESGSLFESQPPVYHSNVYSVDDPDEVVLGYFGASEIKKKRIFIPPKILDHYEIPLYCEPGIVPSLYFQRLFRFGKGIVYFVYYPDPLTGSLHFAIKSCFDCTALEGSTIEKPDFWE